MEGVLYKNFSGNIQEETVNLKLDAEGVLYSDTIISTDDSYTETKNFELNGIEKIKPRLNGHESLDNGESENKPETSSQKVSSSALIESAFKVMKNFFSPDKTKNVSANVTSPVKQNQSASGFLSGSMYNTNKAEISASEPGMENFLTFQTGENSAKNQLNVNQVGVFSPVDPHNNTDESFLTTVSIIDDSFHSAITNLDENGENLNTESSGVVTENFLNNTKNLEMGDACDDTLENSDYCLDNTTLKSCSFSSESSKVGNSSVLSKDEHGECWNSSQINCLCNNNLVNDFEKISLVEAEKDVSNVVYCNQTTQSIKNLINDEALKKKNCPKHDNSCIAGSEESFNATITHTETCHKFNNLVNSKEMENISLHKSLVSSVNSSNTVETFGKQNKICKDSDTVQGGMEIFELSFDNKTIVEENVIPCEDSENVQNIFVENSVSTTTVVLNELDSVDVDYNLMCLKAKDSEAKTTSQTSCTGDLDVENDSSISMTEKQFPKELNHSLYGKIISERTSIKETNSSSPNKSLKTTSSMSEKDYSVNDPNVSKMKPHKSDELIKVRLSSESPEENKVLHEKSSLDVSLIKNSEASKKTHSKAAYEFKADFDTAELNIQFRGHLNEQNHSELDKSITHVVTIERSTLPLITQQSYTILTTHDNNLNKPIIEPININKDVSEKHTFQKNNSGVTCSLETPIPENHIANNCYISLGEADSAALSEQKQSTPLWKKIVKNSPVEKGQTPIKPTSLNMSSSEIKELVCQEKNKVAHSSDFLESDFATKSIEMFYPNEDPAEISPVTSLNENGLLFLNSVESEIGQISDINRTLILPTKEPDEQIEAFNKKVELKSTPTEEVGDLNQTFDKHMGSLEAHKLNQTFDKSKSLDFGKPIHSLESSPEVQIFNTTFDKNTSSGNKSKITFTKKIKSMEIDKINQTFNVTELSEGKQMNKTFDKTFVNKILNQSLDNKTDYSVSQVMNETFDKSPPSPIFSETNQRMDSELLSSILSVTNQTFVKETDCNSNKGINMTFEKSTVPEAAECGRSLEIETQVDEVRKVLDAPTKGSHHSTLNLANVLSSEQPVTNDVEIICRKDLSESLVSERSSNTSLVGSEFSTVLLNEGLLSKNQSIEDLSEKVGMLDLNESLERKEELLEECSAMLPKNTVNFGAPTEEQNPFIESNSPSVDKLGCDPYLVQLIQEQFSSNDIEKICSVVEDLSSMKLSSQILKASEQFDKSFHENLSNNEFKALESEVKPKKLVNPLSPQSFDFLNSIQGKPTGRDWSRESLYVKFDPLVQPDPNSLIDFTKEGEALTVAEKSPIITQKSNICEQLLTMSPQKKTDDIVPPLTPLSHRAKCCKSEDKTERIKGLQNEIYFLKNLYAERERTNRVKLEEYESQVAKLTGESCFLEDRLKESNEREKALVKKMKEQAQGVGQLKIIMEEYVKVISKLTAELGALKIENQKHIEALSSEKDSYMTHLQNTEAAFTDVHAKYEKSKKTIVSLKTNEVMYRNKIVEQAQKLEDFKGRAKEAQEKALKEFKKIQEELDETKGNHNQETTRLRAQLRKTELKLEALQESLEQKIKENQQLTAICDELIEGKK